MKRLLLVILATGCGSGGGGYGSPTPTPSPSPTGTPAAPPITYDGDVASADVGAWDAANPDPVIIATRYDASTTWYVGGGSIESDGSLSNVVTDVARLWRWTSSDPGAPSVLYDGPVSSAVVPGWNASAPVPLLVYARETGTQRWSTLAVAISSNGTVSGIVADRVRVWGWSASTAPPQILDGAVGDAVPGWSSTNPEPVLFFTRYTGSSSGYASAMEVAANGATGGVVTDEVTAWAW